MKREFNRKKIFLIPLMVVAFLALISYVIMQLWNNLMPEIFNLGVITFWQAMGLFVLCKILFGFGKSGRMGGPPWMRSANRFKNLSAEERERCRTELKNRMCWKSDKPKEEAPIATQPDL